MPGRSIWVFIEQEAGEIEESSLGVLTRAREIADEKGGTVTAILLGKDVKDKAAALGKYGAHKVIVAEHPVLETYHPEAYFQVMTSLIEERRPHTVLFSATRNGRDLAGRLAVRFKTGLMAHVISLDYSEDDRLVGGVPGFGGNIVAVVKHTKGSPQLATVSPGVFAPREAWREAEVETVEPRIDEAALKVRIVERRVGEFIDISKSKRVVIAGMGTGGNIEIAKQLAEAIGADLGVTRPLADMGVAPRDIQVGSTGVILKGDLVIVLGASGAPHFVSGIRDVGKVITINKDPNAPILEYSDYFAVGDLFEIVPLLIKKLKESGG